MTNVKFIHSSYSSVAWSIEFTCLTNPTDFVEGHYKVVYTLTDGYRLSYLMNDGLFSDYNRVSAEYVLGLLPANEIWTWEKLVTVIEFFSEGYKKGRKDLFKQMRDFAKEKEAGQSENEKFIENSLADLTKELMNRAKKLPNHWKTWHIHSWIAYTFKNLFPYQHLSNSEQRNFERDIETLDL